MAFWAYFFSAYAYNDSDDFERADKASAKARELAQALGLERPGRRGLPPAVVPQPSPRAGRGRRGRRADDRRGGREGLALGLPSGASVLGEALLERGELDRAADACELPGGDEQWSRLIAYMWLLDTRARVQLARGDAPGAWTTFLECGEGWTARRS